MNAGKSFQEIANFLFVAEGRLTGSASHDLCKQCRNLRNGELKQLEAEHAALVAVAEAAKVIQLDSKISAWLELNDPQANIQLNKAISALAAVRAGQPTETQPKYARHIYDQQQAARRNGGSK